MWILEEEHFIHRQQPGQSLRGEKVSSESGKQGGGPRGWERMSQGESDGGWRQRGDRDKSNVASWVR